MTLAAQVAAEAMKHCCPTREDLPELTEHELEVARRQWGRCLGALAEGLTLRGALASEERIAFYRAAGLEIHD